MTEQQRQPAVIRAGNRALSVVEDYVYVGVAAVLGVGAAVLLVQAGVDTVKAATADDITAGMVVVLDSLLLVFIFVELLFAVRTTLDERQVVAEPFLLVGILAAIKEIVVLAIKAPEEYLEKGPEFARAMVEIGVLAGVIAVLAGAAIVLRRKEREPQEGSGGQGSGTQKPAA